MNEFESQKEKLLNKIPLIKILKINFRSFISLILKIKKPKALILNIYMVIYQFRSEKNLNKKIKYLYGVEALDFLLESNKSFIRLGDSEIHHMLDSAIIRKDEGFQVKTSDLTSRMRNIINDLNTSSPYLIGFNLTFLKMSDLKLLRTGLFSLHYQQRYYFKKHLNKINDLIVLDAMIFRPVSNLDNSTISKLYLNKDVIIVHNDNNVYKSFKDSHTTGYTHFIKIISKNAFEHCDDTIEKVYQISKDYELDKLVCMISGGPAAKVIAHELSKLGLLTYDMGHYFKWKFFEKNDEGAL